MTIIPMILAMSLAIGVVAWVVFFMGELGGGVKGTGPTPPTDKDAAPKLSVVLTDARGSAEAPVAANQTEKSRAA